MNNLDDLRAIWHTAKTDSLPTSKEMLKLVKKFRSQKLRNKWLVIIVSVLIAGLVLFVLCTTHFKLLSTYIGGGLAIASVLLLAATNIRSLKRFYELDNCSNLEFLAFIEQTRQNQIYYYKRTMVIIMVLYSAGWMLYMYEPVYKHPTWLFGVYFAMLIYLALMWFIVRPRFFKKNAAKLNEMRQRLESISQQLK
jgi:TRAP-type uncharacterized transport system fused permease subunit